MFRDIVNQAKSHVLVVLLLVFGFFTGILGESIATSLIVFSDTNNAVNRNNVVLSVTGGFTIKNYQTWIISNGARYGEVSTIIPGFHSPELPTKAKSSLFINTVYYTHNTIWKPELAYGRMFTIAEAESRDHVAIVGKAIVPKLGKNKILLLNGEHYRIIGVIPGDKNNQIFIPLLSVPATLLTMKVGAFDPSFIFNPGISKDSASSTLVELAIKFLSHIESASIVTMSSSIPGNSAYNATVVSLAGILVLIVAALNLSNLSILWVLDRGREMDIRKAIGATDRSLLVLVVGEMSALALICALLAVAVQGLIGIFVHGSMSEWFHVTGWNIVSSLATSLLVVLISGLPAVRNLARFNPVETLRIG